MAMYRLILFSVLNPVDQERLGSFWFSTSMTDRQTKKGWERDGKVTTSLLDRETNAVEHPAVEKSKSRPQKYDSAV